MKGDWQTDRITDKVNHRGAPIIKRSGHEILHSDNWTQKKTYYGIQIGNCPVLRFYLGVGSSFAHRITETWPAW